jgi:hypothetical protein
MITQYFHELYFQSKLIKLFGKQLVAKNRLQLDDIPEVLQQYPNIEQWLHIVGFPDDVAKVTQLRYFDNA